MSRFSPRDFGTAMGASTSDFDAAFGVTEAAGRAHATPGSLAAFDAAFDANRSTALSEARTAVVSAYAAIQGGHGGVAEAYADGLVSAALEWGEREGRTTEQVAARVAAHAAELRRAR